jgi:hypothetical protein
MVKLFIIFPTIFLFKSEDKCLFACLVKKFVDEFGCIHPRLAMMNNTVNMTAEEMKVISQLQSYDLSFSKGLKVFTFHKVFCS